MFKRRRYYAKKRRTPSYRRRRKAYRIKRRPYYRRRRFYKRRAVRGRIARRFTSDKFYLHRLYKTEDIVITISDTQYLYGTSSFRFIFANLPDVLTWTGSWQYYKVMKFAIIYRWFDTKATQLEVRRRPPTIAGKSIKDPYAETVDVPDETSWGRFIDDKRCKRGQPNSSRSFRVACKPVIFQQINTAGGITYTTKMMRAPWLRCAAAPSQMEHWGVQVMTKTIPNDYANAFRAEVYVEAHIAFRGYKK